jgi:hypothetical protein
MILICVYSSFFISVLYFVSTRRIEDKTGDYFSYVEMEYPRSGDKHSPV